MPYTPLSDVLLPRISLPNQLFEVSFLSPLDNYEHLILLDETLDVSYNEFMLKLLKELDLFHALISLFLIIHVEDLSLYREITVKVLLP